MNTKKIFLGVLFLLTMLWGCSPALNGADTFGSESPRAWFDAPLPGTVFYPPNPCLIVAHGASPDGIAVFELLINGQAVSVLSPDTAGSLVTLNRDCAIIDPGTYALQLRAQDNAGNWSGYAETYFIIPGAEGEALPPPPTESIVTAVPSPTLTPAPSAAEEFSITTVSTWVVYVGESSCGPQETVITAHAKTAKGIAAVVLFYRFPGTGFQSVSMISVGNDHYQGTISMTSIFGNSIPFDQAILEYQVVVQQNDGDTSLRTPVLADIEARACGSSEESGGETDACNAYTDQRTCIAKGCNWWEIPGTVPQLVCKSKP